MDYVAHRGYAEEFPENTLSAFRGAAASADWIEFDVRRCGSGELVVCHDGTLERLADDERTVGCTPWSELRTVEVLGSGETIPRLDDALDAIPPDVGVQIELKELDTAADVLAATADHDNPAILISFSPLALREAREADPDAPLGYVLHDGIYGDDPELGIDTAANLGCEAVHMYYATGSEPAVVEYAHDHGLAVQTAVPEAGPTEGVLETCRTAGVDRLSTDERPEH
ncbi:glycerophosphodiester phosphodiesterase [Halobellus ruber]|uniref:Glycerophosphodiester phosphodiesterase n=1 Tax=Halobellus ruber TaxID=2761102 RepID=A0A7J9SKU4_9EURY|nr:glycerophosphodiester phosphodiesterase [Halobellus ruber]MBB6645651.1 glycerophosphodiester phosphodiesterase [Halobellus ruber]